MFRLQLPTLAVLVWLPGLIIGFTVHELAHALVAYWMGDRGAVTRERLTLNPIKQISWLGLAAFLLLGFGWAKPVRFRPAAFKYANLGSLLVSLAGVTANALLATLFLILLFVIVFIGSFIAAEIGLDPYSLTNALASNPLTPLNALVASLTSEMVEVNYTLALFNLIPIPGFDGFHALRSLGQLIVRYKLPHKKDQQVAIALEDGNYLARRGQMALAVQAWRQALTLDPECYSALYNLGLAYKQAGQRHAAQRVLANAARVARDDQERQQTLTLLEQVSWESEQLASPIAVSELPELAAPLPEQKTTANHRLLMVAAIIVGALVGLVAYVALIIFLMLVTAGLRF